MGASYSLWSTPLAALETMLRILPICLYMCPGGSCSVPYLPTAVGQGGWSGEQEGKRSQEIARQTPEPTPSHLVSPTDVGSSSEYLDAE